MDSSPNWRTGESRKLERPAAEGKASSLLWKTNGLPQSQSTYVARPTSHKPTRQAASVKRQGPKAKGRLTDLRSNDSVIFLVRTFRLHSITAAGPSTWHPWRPDQLGVGIRGGAKVGRAPYLALPGPPPLLAVSMISNQTMISKNKKK